MGRRNRRNVNADDFTTPEMAQEANNAATRDAVSMDVYGTQTTFQAIVLTEPVPMSTAQIGDLYGSSRDDGAQVLPRFQFKGRIVGGDLPSPHHYLPDPCRLDLSINTQTTLDLISMHTTFISEVGYSGGRPSVGDAVEVELEAGDVKFNLQYGTFKGIVNSAQISSPQRSMECVSLAAKLSSTSNLRTLRGSEVGNIREREVVGGIEEQVVTIRGPHIRNPNNRKAKPEAIAWLNAVLAAVNRRLAAGETSTSDVPHATRTDSNGPPLRNTRVQSYSQ